MPFPKTYRTNIWWAVIVSCIVGLVAGKGTITRTAIVALVVFAGTSGYAVAWEHKWLKGIKGKTRVTVVICLFMGLAFWAMWPPHGLSVSPESVTYNSEGTSQYYLFTVKNNEDEAVYVAEVALRVRSSALNTNSFQIYVPSSSLKPMYEHSAFSDICGMFAAEKKSNRPLFLFQVFYLAPHETREIGLTHVGSGGATTIDAIPSAYKTTAQPGTADPYKQTCTYYGLQNEDIVIHGEFMLAMDGRVATFDMDKH